MFENISFGLRLYLRKNWLKTDPLYIYKRCLTKNYLSSRLYSINIDSRQILLITWLSNEYDLSTRPYYWDIHSRLSLSGFFMVYQLIRLILYWNCFIWFIFSENGQPLLLGVFLNIFRYNPTYFRNVFILFILIFSNSSFKLVSWLFDFVQRHINHDESFNDEI